jgi:phosphinothricin acetyltransferase
MAPERSVIRPAGPGDAPAIAAIFNQGIGERVATFETRDQTPEGVAALLERRRVALVAELDDTVSAFAWVGSYDDAHAYYSGVGEATMYVERGARRSGVGTALIGALADAAADAGFHKLVGKAFTSNEASLAMLQACGWRQVGVHRRHGRLDGEWRDVVVVERLVGEAAEPS